MKPEEEWVLRSVEPIVSEELWDRCSALIDEQRSRRPPARKTVGLFSGIARCHCGARMYPKTGTGKYLCTSCRHKIPIADLEELFHHQLRSFFFSDEQLQEFWAEGDAEVRRCEEELAALERERKKLITEKDKAYRLYIDDQIDGTAFADIYNPIFQRKEEIETRLAELQAEIDVRKIDRISGEEIVTGARQLYDRWDDLSREEKRSIVEAITERIIIGRDEIEIHLHFVPSEESGKKATNHQGFIAAISWKRAG